MRMNTSNSLNLLIILLTHIITQTLATNSNRLNNSITHLLNQSRQSAITNHPTGSISKIHPYHQQQQQHQYIKPLQQTNSHSNSNSNNAEIKHIEVTPTNIKNTKANDSPELSLSNYKTNDDRNKLSNHLNSPVIEDVSTKNHIEVNREAIQSSPSAIVLASPPAATTPGNSYSNSATYPWNLYQPKYAQQPLNYLPPPDTIPTMFTNILPPYDVIRRLLAVTPSILPLITYIQSMYVPYSVYLNPDMLMKRKYTHLLPAAPNGANLKAPISRSSDSFAPVRRTFKDYTTTSSEPNSNSPIYYIRIRPAPYILLPSNTAVWSEGIQQPLVSFGRMLNVPVSFVANGKPTSIYQIDNVSNDLESSLNEGNHNSQLNSHLNPLLPTIPKKEFSETVTRNIDDHLKDSELITLKYTYYFNGRPDDIYVLSNNLLPRHSMDNDHFY